MLPLYTLTIFLSAGLLFLVQPMFARMVLPLLGGSPAVWNTAMVFYQAILLAGYAYAHWSVRHLGLRRQAWIHLGLMAAVFLILPIWIPEGRTPPPESSPIPWLLATLLTGVGLPFFVVSTMSPLLQRWFAATRHREASDPYFLYAAGNLGSMLGLLAYPLILEPVLTLPGQSLLWSVFYGAFFLCATACIARLPRDVRPPRSGTPAAPEPATARPGAGVPGLRRRLLWMLLAFIPSSLMLGITTLLTTDIAAVPLLWVLPLALYLLTFVLVFARRPPVPHAWVRRAVPVAVVAQGLLLATGSTEPFPLLAATHLAAFFIISLACHGELVRRRPEPIRLTEFYLFMSVGGVLGGIFNALLAPVLFIRVIEYPLVLVLACIVLGSSAAGATWRRPQPVDVALPLGLGLAAIAVFLLLQSFPTEQVQVFYGPALGMLMLVLYLNAGHGLRFCAGLAAVLAVSYALHGPPGQLLYAERTFFGVHRVLQDPQTGDVKLMHGNTFHGQQRRNSAESRVPLAYYFPTGPIGQLFYHREILPDAPIAAVGLGSGALAAYSLPGEHWTFYEIDPAVRAIAENPEFFTFLAEARGTTRIQMGDARLMLAHTPDRHYGLIILDAYSSDAIPVHLMTREAFELYRRKLAEGGVLAFHLSNLHLDLRPVVAALAADLGLHGIYRADTNISEDELARGKMPSQWALLAEEPSTLAVLSEDYRWQPIGSGQRQVRPWSDHYSSILQALQR